MITTDLETVACVVCTSQSSVRARMVVPRDEMALELGLPGGRSSWVVCETCGLVFQSPRPGAGAVETLYSEGAYHTNRGGIPEHYVQYSLRRSREALRWGVEVAGRTSRPGRALDVGCGIGGALVTLREWGWSTTGVEPDPNLAQEARDRFDLDVLTTPLATDTFPAGESFDLVYSCHVWEHLTDPIGVSRSAHALLRESGGHLLIVVPTYRQARTMAWVYFAAPHTYMFTDATLGSLLESAGFDVVASRYHAGADSELWLLAKAADRDSRSPVPHALDDVRTVQREIAIVPLRAPLGLPARVKTHVQTLANDPKDFARRLVRWCKARVAQIRSLIPQRGPSAS